VYSVAPAHLLYLDLKHIKKEEKNLVARDLALSANETKVCTGKLMPTYVLP